MSSSLLSSKYFDKLQVNRLKTNEIKSDNILPQSPSYLFSAVFNNASFERNSTGGILTITNNDTESIIEFSDRPFRQTENIDFVTFVDLFDTSGNDSFEEDPPNGVLTHSEEQKTYIIKLLSFDLETAKFNLELLPDETHNLTTSNGRMNLFVDNARKNTIFRNELIQKLQDIMVKYVYSNDDSSYTAHRELPPPRSLNDTIPKKARMYYRFSIYLVFTSDSKISSVLRNFIRRYLSY